MRLIELPVFGDICLAVVAFRSCASSVTVVANDIGNPNHKDDCSVNDEMLRKTDEL